MTDFAFDAPTVIRTKRDGGRLSDAAIDWVVKAYTDGRVADEQMSALLMAIVWRGMDRGEIARWTAAMLASGARLDFTDLPLATVDKHSTGGVGDKITLPLVPVVAACGGAVPQASGRGLGHTGGPGTNLDVEHQCTRTLSQLLAHNRTGDQRQRFDGAGNVAQRIQLGIGWRQLAGGEDRGADVAKLLAHPLVGQIRGEPGDGFQLVQGGPS